MSRIIGICGRAFSGKSLFASYLEAALCRHGVRPYTVQFSRRIKIAAGDLGWDGEKDERGRRFLVEIGRAARQYSSDIFIRHMERVLSDVEPDSVLIIPDVRLKEEAEWIRKNGGHIVKITRNPELRAPAGKFADSDRTETEPDGILPDTLIPNDGSRKDLQDSAECFKEKIKWWGR